MSGNKSIMTVDVVFFLITTVLMYQVLHVKLPWYWSAAGSFFYFILFVGTYSIKEVQKNESKKKEPS